MNRSMLKNTVQICGVIFETLSVLSLLWTLLLCILLAKFGNTKIIVSYVPLLSLCFSTLGHSLLLTFHFIPQLFLNMNVSDTYDATGDFLFFPFWYGLLISLCLLAINRVAICMKLSLNNFVFNTKWMLTFVCIGWLWGFGIGVAALQTDSKYSFLNGEQISKLVQNDDFDVKVNELADQNSTSQLLSQSPYSVGYILIVTQILDCLTVIALLVCYSVVIYHVTKGRRILHAQTSVLLMSIANTIGVIVPDAPAANRNNRVFPAFWKPNKPGAELPTSVGPASKSYFQQPIAQQHGFWAITWHFCLMSSSAAFFGVFVFVSDFFKTPQMVIAQQSVYLFCTLTNVYLLSTVNAKIKELLLRTVQCWKWRPRNSQPLA